MRAKEKLSNYLAEEFEFFNEKLTTEYKYLSLEGDMDYNTAVFVLSINDFKNLTGLKPVTINHYKRYRCGHEYDCCGCLSSQGIEIKKLNNGYVAIFLTTSFNY